MNRGLFALGGIILIGGSVYLLKDYIFPGCINGETKCIGRDLYTCENNQWTLTQENSPQCNGGIEHCQYLLPGDDPGYGYPSGWRSCDPITKELCEWNDTTKTWNLIEENSSICINGIEQNKCYTSTVSNIVTCGIYRGTDPDECFHQDAAGCSCATGECRPICYCCSEDSKCRLKANSTYLFWVDRTSPGVSCWESGGAQYFEYAFNETGIQLFREPIALKRLTEVKIGWEWGPVWPGEPVDVAVWGKYGSSHYTIYHETPSVNNPDGTFDLGTIILSEPKCMDKIQIAMDALVSNIRPTFIECKFAYI